MIGRFVQLLGEMKFDHVFNPYSDFCVVHDSPEAPAIRRRNLSLLLEAATSQPVDALWVGRDLGYRGGRRTGLALVDEASLPFYSRLYGGVPLRKATKGEPAKELTATVVSRVISTVDANVFMWNAFPFHPHLPRQQFSNRAHTRGERDACRPVLMSLFDLLSPTSVVAVGRDAFAALESIGVRAEYVRHPSHGGQKAFAQAMTSRYPARSNSVQLGLF